MLKKIPATTVAALGIIASSSTLEQASAMKLAADQAGQQRSDPWNPDLLLKPSLAQTKEQLQEVE